MGFVQMSNEKIGEMLCEGFYIEEIADAVCLSIPSVKKRLKALRTKYKARNNAHLAVKLTMLRICHELL